MKEWITDLKQLNIGKLEINTSIKKYTTYQIGGNAACVVNPKSIEKLVQ